MLQKFISLDRFSAPVQLNIKGDTEIGSYTGSCLSIILFVILFIFSVQKFQEWAFIQNPNVVASTYSNNFDSNYTVNLTEIGLQFAFGVNDYVSNKPLDDPNYVKWVVSIIEFKNNKKVGETPINFHKCSQENYDAFYPPAQSHQWSIQNMRDSNFSLYCIDPSQNLTISGFDKVDSRQLQFRYMPCTPNFKTQTCINQSLDSIKTYLGNLPQIYILQNRKRFDFNNYQKSCDPIHESIFDGFFLNMLQPSTIDGTLEMKQVQDEINLLHFGKQNIYDYWGIEYSPLRISATNVFPSNYAFILLNIRLSADLEITQRTSYDFLQFIGDVGGLDFILTLIGSIIISQYQKFNFYTYLISILFVKSNQDFQNFRNIMKPKIDNQINARESNKSTPSIFQTLRRKTLVFQLKEDFNSRKEIARPTLAETVFGWLCRCKFQNKFLRKYKRGIKKVNQDLDIIKILKQYRMSKVQFFSLLDLDQLKLSYKLAEYVLSEFSSSDDSNSNQKQNRIFPQILLFDDTKDDQEQAYLERLVNQDQIEQNQRLLKIYWHQDQDRNQKWNKAHPEAARHQNVKMLKQLIARNLTKPREVRVQNFEITNQLGQLEDLDFTSPLQTQQVFDQSQLDMIQLQKMMPFSEGILPLNANQRPFVIMPVKQRLKTNANLTSKQTLKFI